MSSIHIIDYAIILSYCTGIIAAGFYFSRRAASSVDDYFLGGRKIPWYLLGISNASGMFDITGTMWMVMLLYVYGLKSLWIPWLWPTFNQVFLMIFLAAWLRRSGVLTGAQWLKTRFGSGTGGELAHVSVVLFALITVVAFIGYSFIGIGKFAESILPWDLTANSYATIVLCITALYVVLGGMYSVVVTDVIQFVLLTTASLLIGVIAMMQCSASEVAAATPEGWSNIWFGWQLQLDWSQLMPQVRQTIAEGGYQYFTPFLMMALAKGILASIAGPTPGYDMQRVLAAKDERAASLMSGIVSPVLFVPRYLLIGGICLLALVHFSPELSAQANPDFEKLLPEVLQRFIPVGLTGILLAGLLAAFMSTFDSTVNAGAAYLVNDVYLRYFDPQASQKTLIRASYLASLLVVASGMVLGRFLTDINSQLQWIVGGLYGGYVAPNVLKWIWWRLNGAGYFAGMVAGVAMSLLFSWKQEAILAQVAEVAPDFHELMHTQPVLYSFPVLLLGSGLVSVLVTMLTAPDDIEVLKDFARKVRPWGFWGYVNQQIAEEDPQFTPNQDFYQDMLNSLVGIFWQVSLCAMPVFLLLRAWVPCAVSLLIAAGTTVWLKFNWYDKKFGQAELESTYEQSARFP